MSVGNLTNKLTIDSTVGPLAQQIQTWSARVDSFKEWLDTMPDATLEAEPFSYTPDDVALLKSATNDMFTLSQVYQGKIDHTPASDLSVFVGRIAGVPMV